LARALLAVLSALALALVVFTLKLAAKVEPAASVGNNIDENAFRVAADAAILSYIKAMLQYPYFCKQQYLGKNDLQLLLSI
jgi:hypothetical protein